MPIPATLHDKNDYIEVYLETNTDRYTLTSREIHPGTISALSNEQKNELDLNTNLPAVDLREVHWIVSKNAEFGPSGTFHEPQMQSQLNRVGYGSQGFETFHVSVPNKLRGKAVRLRFRLFGDTPAYIDNVSFKSENLKFGNPSEARAFPTSPTFVENYLIEKPQYSVSYDHILKQPNWVSYQINPSWLVGTLPERPRFAQDYSLPFEDRTKEEDYSGKIKGHLTGNKDRVRVINSYHEAQNAIEGLPVTPSTYPIKKDNFETFNTTCNGLKL